MPQHIYINHSHFLGKSSVTKEVALWAVRALTDRPDVELSIYFADIKEVTALNKKWRKQDRPTNVLSFPAIGGQHPKQRLLLGDVVICLEVVESEASIQKKSLQQHLCHIVIHGILHLLGYGHDEEIAATRMEEREIQILSEFNYPNPYLKEAI